VDRLVDRRWFRIDSTDRYGATFGTQIDLRIDPLCNVGTEIDRPIDELCNVGTEIDL
jgi:hypothetical protein